LPCSAGSTPRPPRSKLSRYLQPDDLDSKVEVAREWVYPVSIFILLCSLDRPCYGFLIDARARATGLLQHCIGRDYPCKGRPESFRWERVRNTIGQCSENRKAPLALHTANAAFRRPHQNHVPRPYPHVDICKIRTWIHDAESCCRTDR
jgi:hypothetical protein